MYKFSFVYETVTCQLLLEKSRQTLPHTHIQRIVCFADCLSIATVMFFIFQEMFKTRPILEAVEIKMHIKMNIKMHIKT